MLPLRICRLVDPPGERLGHGLDGLDVECIEHGYAKRELKMKVVANGYFCLVYDFWTYIFPSHLASGIGNLSFFSRGTWSAANPPSPAPQPN